MALHPQPPLLAGIWGALPTHSQSSPPNWLQPLLASLPCPLSGLVALSATRVSALLAARGREGQTWVGSQGYGVNGALCPFRQSLSWAKEIGDREECKPASTCPQP